MGVCRARGKRNGKKEKWEGRAAKGDNGKGKAGKARKGERGGWWGTGKGRAECIDGKVAVVLEERLRHVYLSHTSVEIEPGSSGSIADSCVGTVVEEVKTGLL